ncbi:hypothetical protein RCH10_005200 [Variovorax sp. GrIS 2.14]|uniref:hypothetical protein n=1 Tax=Variovorax sp. GrIS 2.14 TaxID=3071709 RepID=UPI0038F716FC
MPSAIHDVPLANVRCTANFALDLKRLEVFWFKNGAADGYDKLLDALADVLVCNLQRHPGIGRPFLDRTVDSVEAESLSERVGLRLSALGDEAQLREYVLDQYLVLYAYLRGSVDESGFVQLLAIKHQNQLGFDMPPKG